jgi:DNA-binding NtrC family response regulator
LIVDDEKIIADTLAMIFQLAGYRAVAAYNATDAFKQSVAFLPDLLITDLVMPDLHGIELAAKVQASCPSCKVLLLSGQIEAADPLITAVFDFAHKPINPEDLLTKAHVLITGTSEQR